MKTYRSEQFYFHTDTRKFTADASDLGLTARAMSTGATLDDRVYNDACDVGFAILSHRTGKLAVYALKNTDEKDGEVRAWEYEAVRPHESMLCSKGELANWSEYEHTSVVVFND